MATAKTQTGHQQALLEKSPGESVSCSILYVYFLYELFLLYFFNVSVFLLCILFLNIHVSIFFFCFYNLFSVSFIDKLNFYIIYFIFIFFVRIHRFISRHQIMFMFIF